MTEKSKTDILIDYFKPEHYDGQSFSRDLQDHFKAGKTELHEIETVMEEYASQYKTELYSKEALIGELKETLEGVMRLKDLWLPPDNIEPIEDEHKGEYLALGAMHDKILTALNKLK